MQSFKRFTEVFSLKSSAKMIKINNNKGPKFKAEILLLKKYSHQLLHNSLFIYISVQCRENIEL